jgi:tetratricopeptide (TPR) repeat protein
LELGKHKSADEEIYVRNVVNELKRKYEEVKKGTVSFEDFSVLLVRLMRLLLKLYKDNREIIDTNYRESLQLLLINLSANVNEYRTVSNLDDRQATTDLNRKIMKIVGQILIELDKIYPVTYGPSSIMRTASASTLSKPKRFRGEKVLFIGRQNTVEELREDLSKPGIRLSIVGMPGIGKSAVAFKAIHECESVFDIVIPIYVGTEKITYSDLLLKVAKGLSIPVDEFEKLTPEVKTDVLYDALEKQNQPLIFMDNYGSVASNTGVYSSKDTMLINSFFDNLPTSTSVVLTSRERTINESKVVYLEGFTTQEGKDLFLILAEDHIKDVSQEIIEQIENLVDLVGGNPLCIEIMAKSLQGLGLGDIRKLFKDLSIVLDKYKKESPMKFLEGTFYYLINKLEYKNRELLYYLTLCKSPFPDSVASEIFAFDKKDVVSLFEKGLLERIESDEYGEIEDFNYWLYNFHPAMRDYLENFIQGISLDIAKRYGEEFSYYYYRLVYATYRALGKENHVPMVARFSIMYQGENNDFDRSITMTTNRQLSADISSLLGLTLDVLGSFNISLDYHRKALAIHEELRDKVAMAGDYTNIGRVLYVMGRFDEALEYLKKSLDIGRELGDQVGMAGDYTNIGRVLHVMGRFDEALDYFKMSANIFENMGDKNSVTSGYNNLGIAFADAGRFDEALEYHRKALAIHEELGDKVGMGVDCRNLGRVSYLMGRFDEALEYLKKSLDIGQELGDQVGMAEDYSGISYVLVKVNRFDEALEYLNKSFSLHEELGNKVGMAEDYRNIGNVLQDKEKFDEALEYHRKAVAIHEELRDKVGMAGDYRNIGSVLQDKKKFDEALEYHRKALAIHEELRDKVGMAGDYNSIGRALHVMGRFDEALEYHRKALAIHEELGDKVGMGVDYYNMSLIFRDSHEKNKSFTSLSDAKSTLESFEQETGYHHPLLKEIQSSLTKGNLENK